MKKGWNCEKINGYGGYNGSYKIYKIVSPNGNVYELHNSCNKFPHFYLQTDMPGVYDKYVGDTFYEAVQNIYQLEEKQVIKPLKETYSEQLYEHSFYIEKGYSVRKVDMTRRFYHKLKLLHPYHLECRMGFIVYSTETEQDFYKAKTVLQSAMNEEYGRRLQEDIVCLQSRFNELNSKLNTMFDISNLNEKDNDITREDERDI